MSSRRFSSIKPAPTVFVGRKAALLALAQAVERSRLVTILGPPGTGKTRLAREHALSTLGGAWAPLGTSSFEGGVFFVDLSEATTPDEVVIRIAQALDVDVGARRRGAAQTLVSRLEASAPALVILDNFEQLVRSSASLVASLVAANDRTRWLVTSRERLRVPAEALFDLGPLGEGGEAVELFVERARAASGPFDLGADGLADVTELVARLDGLPLAIELAAARTRVLSPREIIDRLGKRFDLLTRDVSTIHRRNATLWETIDASWSMLGAEEQAALGLLSVFRGGFDVRAAERVLAAGPSTLDWLGSLRDKSLLVIEEGEGTQQRRFGLLASIREFAAERIDETTRRLGEERHAEHYLELGEKSPWSESLAVEHENLMAVHRRFLGPKPDLALRAALVLYKGASAFPYALCLGLLDDAIAAVSAVQSPARDVLVRLARALEARGNLRRFVGRTDESLDDFERMRALADRLGERALVAAALAGLGNGATVRARWSEARARFEEALAIFGEERLRSAEGPTLAMLAATRFNEDEPEEARELLVRAQAFTRAARDRTYEGICTTSMGIVDVALGALAEARTHLGDALRIHREVGARHWEGVTLAYLAMVDHDANRNAEAHEQYERAISLLHEIDVRRAEGLARFSRAGLWLAEGHVAKAKLELHLALDLCRAMAPDHEGLVLGALGAVAAIEGDLAAAADLNATAEIALRPYTRRSFAVAIATYGGLRDVAEARAGAEAKRALHEKPARDKLAVAAAIAPRSFEVRVALRLLERALDSDARGASDKALVVGPDGVWFRAPRSKSSVRLHRRGALKRIVHELAQKRARAPGEALRITELVAAGWPGQRVLPEAGTDRVYAAVATLRKLGLKGILLQRDDGYLFDPSLDLVRSPAGR